jgi:hypothetical protein
MSCASPQTNAIGLSPGGGDQSTFGEPKRSW